MTYVRGDEAQFNAWEKLGNPGWNWNTLLRYYKQIERFYTPENWQQAVGASFDRDVHGLSGDLHVGFNPDMPNGTFYDTIKQTFRNVGEPTNPDASSGHTRGFDVWPQTIDPARNLRWDAAMAFYWPVQGRPNLQLVNGTVSRIIWESGCEMPTAGGVEYIDPAGETRTLAANKEVILSAGALRTPLVLEMSGIGNPRILDKHGIKTVVDLPTVGENMIDQANIVNGYLATKNSTDYSPYAVFANARDIYGDKVQSVAQETKASLRQWARQISEASGGAVKAEALEHIYNIQHDLVFNEHTTISETLIMLQENYIFSIYWALLPFGRGSVHLSSPRNLSSPAINPAFFSLPHDLSTSTAIGRAATRFWRTAPASGLVGGGLVVPNSTTLPADATDAQWGAFLRGTAASNSHALGTAAMMARALGGVVDARLRVYGAKGVRVADASVLPMQFSGHLSATVYAVAARAADMILEDGRCEE